MIAIITKNTTWKTGQIISLKDDLQIAPNVTVTVEPGVQIKGGSITAFGTLRAVGTKAKPILFEDVDISYAGQHDGPQGRVALTYVQIAGGSFLRATGNAAYGSFSIDNSIVKDTSYYTHIWYPIGENSIKKTIFLGSHVDFGIDGRGGNSISIEKSIFSSSSLTNWANYGENGAVIRSNSYIDSNLSLRYDSGSFSSPNSYFGTTSEEKIQNMILDRSDDLNLSTYIDITGYRHRAPDGSPSELFSFVSVTLPRLVVEDGRLLGSKDIWLTGNKLNNLLIGNTGDNLLRGLSGTDDLRGGAGNDTLVGGSGADSLDGGKGKDTASYLGAKGGVTANLQMPTKNTGDATGDTYYSIENLTGSGEADTLVGNDSANAIRGGNGNDTLEGRADRDTLTGGKGADIFVFKSIKDSPNNKNGWDVITDFNRKQGDKIHLKAIDAKTGKGNQAFKFIGDDAFSGKKGELRYDKLATNTFVYGDINGDSRADFRIEFTKPIEFVTDDFVL